MRMLNSDSRSNFRFSLGIFFLSLGFLSGLTAGAESLHAKEDAVMHSQIFMLNGYHINKQYLSMMGPIQSEMRTLQLPQGPQTLWVKSFSTEVLDAQGNAVSLEYLCHSWIRVPVLPESPERTARDGLLTISQGLPEMRFPDGYAMAAPIDNNSQVLILGQLLNNNEKIDAMFDAQLTMRYITDADARVLGLKDLHGDWIHIPRAEAVIQGIPSTYGNRDGSAMDGMLMDNMENGGGLAVDGVDGAHKHAEVDDSHFVVPPGNHVYNYTIPTNDSFYRDARIHFIKLHLHPYGQWVRLTDATTHKMLWQGNIVNDPKRRAILRADDYSSTEGIRIYKNHVYQMSADYDNPTKGTIDAMAVLRVYFGDDEVPPKAQ